LLYSIDCNADIAAQDATYPTYKYIDCDLHTNANDSGFYGRLIDCDLAIITTLVTACTNWNQGIRLLVTIDDVPVTSALIGNLNINHNKNMASTFSLSLGDTQYSPHINSNIELSKVVVITAYINGFEKKMFTGIIDDIDVSYSPKFSINISGMDYGKKLLEKRDTLVSVQDETASSLRNEIIEYMAGQASVTNVDIPLMDTVAIDNSFSDQSIWDMIQKEALVNLYWVRFNEDGVMQLRLDEIKSDTTTYPTVDWTYGEDRVSTLGFRKNKSNIINKIIVLGKTTESRIPILNPYDDILTISKSWSLGEATAWNEIVGDFNIVLYIRSDKTEYETSYVNGYFRGGGDFGDLEGNTDGGIILTSGIIKNLHPTGFTFYITRFKEAGTLKAGSIMINIKGVKYTTTYETRYDQISARVTDPSSITKHTERDGGSLELPLIETQDQCVEIGSKIVRDSHRGLGEPDFEVPLNPLLIVGQTIEITDKKIGFSADRWHVESVSHNINFGNDGIKGRTQAGCVYYAST